MNTKHLIVSIIIILVVIAAGVAWYFYSAEYLQDYLMQGSDATENIDYEDDSAAEISADLEKTPDDSELNGDMNSLDAQVQGF
ncbi:MAG: hypothetical protein Q7S10_01910 [bacterium]|nr:hypothetical protein [bacterium]